MTRGRVVGSTSPSAFKARAGSACDGCSVGKETEAVLQVWGLDRGNLGQQSRAQWFGAIKTEDRTGHQVLFLAAEESVCQFQFTF